MDYRPIFRSIPRADESWDGFLHRIAWNNGFENIPQLSEFLQKAPITIDDVELFLISGDSELTANSDDQVEWYINFQEPRQRVNLDLKSTPAFCPECLSVKSYYRKIWDHACYAVCHEHSTALHDRCPECKSRLSWSNLYLWRCKCGLHISKFQRTDSDKEGISSEEINQAKSVAVRLKKSSLPVRQFLEDLTLVVRPGSLSPARLRFGTTDRMSTIPWLAAAGLSIEEASSDQPSNASYFLSEKKAALASGNPEIVQSWRQNHVSPFLWNISSHSKRSSVAAVELHTSPSSFEALSPNLPCALRVEAINRMLSPRDLARILKIRTLDIYRFEELGLLTAKNPETKSFKHKIFDWEDVYAFTNRLAKNAKNEPSSDFVRLMDLIQSGELVRHN